MWAAGERMWPGSLEQLEHFVRVSSTDKLLICLSMKMRRETNNADMMLAAEQVDHLTLNVPLRHR